MKKTKIICTMGPNSDDREVMKQLLLNGMDVARFNFSHGTHDEQRARYKQLREVAEEVGKPVAALLDTKGPEIRTGVLKDGKKVTLTAGEEIILTTEDIVGDAKRVHINYNGLNEDVTEGNVILIDDGLIELHVERVEGTEIYCRIMNGGELGERKGVNVPNVKIKLPALTDKDKEDIRFGIELGFDYIAASFIRSADAIREIRQMLDEGGSSMGIIAKIENQEGLDNIDEIIEASYGIMVARGDLGVELPAEVIPNTQRRIVEKCICAKRPVIIATQMLYSMVKSPRPTRAEVSDVASAIYERVDAVMLSDETAMGDFPVQSVETMARIAREIERDETHFKPMIDMDMVSVNHEITAQLARSAVRASTNLPIKYVVLDTKTGRTGRYLAAFRGRKTVMAVCYQLHAQRILALSYGVVPILRNQELSDRYHFLVDALEFLDQYRKLDDGDLMAIVGGSFGPDGGASYVEIANVQNIRKRNEEIVAQHNC